MRPFPVLLLMFTLVTASFAAEDRHETVREPLRPIANGAVFCVPGEVIVGWEAVASDGPRKARSSELAAVFDLETLPSPGLERYHATRFRSATMDESTLASLLAAAPGVRYAEPNVIVYPAAVPTDPLYGGIEGIQTDLQRWAFGGVGENKVLDAEAAWDLTLGDPSIVIAVLDSGIDPQNPEYENIWVNRDEVPGNGRDDDANGYVDDVNGYNFNTRNGDIRPALGDGEDNDFNGFADDSASHGPYVASIIGASHDDYGMAGAAPGCTLMGIRIYGDDGGVPIDQLVEAVNYATDNGANVINLSLATLFNLQSLREAVEYAASENVVVVSSAGNSGTASQQYPASYPTVVAVGGSDSGIRAPLNPRALKDIDGRWQQSEYGPAAVDVVAPAVTLAGSFVTMARQIEDPELVVGEPIYDIVEGTSFAAPYVAGLAGLVIARDIAIHGERTLDCVDIRALLMNSATDLPTDYRSSYAGASWDNRGRVNFLAALAEIPGGGEPKPDISYITFRKKDLRITGTGFSRDSTIEVNGQILTGEVRFSYAEAFLRMAGRRKELHIKKKSDNVIVVIERGVRSPEYIFRFR